MSILIFEAPYRTKEKRYEAPPQYVKLKWWPPQASHADKVDLGALRWAPALLTFLRLLADASKLSHAHPQHQKMKIDTCDYDEKCMVCVLPYSSNTALHKIMHYSWMLKKSARNISNLDMSRKKTKKANRETMAREYHLRMKRTNTHKHKQ